AGALITTLLAAGQVEMLTQRVEQADPGFQRDHVAAVVDVENHGDCLRPHGCSTLFDKSHDGKASLHSDWSEPRSMARGWHRGSPRPVSRNALVEVAGNPGTGS